MGITRIQTHDSPPHHSLLTWASASRMTTKLRQEDACSTPCGRQRSNDRNASPIRKSQGTFLPSRNILSAHLRARSTGDFTRAELTAAARMQEADIYAPGNTNKSVAPSDNGENTPSENGENTPSENGGGSDA